MLIAVYALSNVGGVGGSRFGGWSDVATMGRRRTIALIVAFVGVLVSTFQWQIHEQVYFELR